MIRNQKPIWKRLFSSPKITVGILIVSVSLASAVGVQAHKVFTLSPGPLTESNKTGEEINGYVSHADFEQDCGHCHGPIHCVEDTNCQDCHMEVAQERASDTGLHSRLPGVTQCQTCHTEHEGREAVITSFAYANINHELLAEFSLEKHSLDYAEKSMDCESCHNQDSFISATLDCVSCHSNEDHDFMAGHIDLYGPDCTSCHDGRGNYSQFQHADVYPLDGEHGNAECQECHQEKVFAGTPQECHSCHEDPLVHAGIFGYKCERCHTATAWLPAELTKHIFLVDHGDETNIKCETCHEHTYTEYPCYSCHEQEEMKTDHDKEGIYAYENCVECHPSGKEGEAGQYMDQKSGSNYQNANPGEGGYQDKGALKGNSGKINVRIKRNAN